MAFLLIICLKCAYILNVYIMKENFLSILGGVSGAIISIDALQVAMQAGGVIITAFVGGMVGLAGKDCYIWLKNWLNNRREKRNHKKQK